MIFLTNYKTILEDANYGWKVKNINKYLSIVLVFTLVAIIILSNTSKLDAQDVNNPIRTVRLAGSEVDVQSILAEYEDVSLSTEQSVTKFTGYRTLDDSILSNVDNVSETDMANLVNQRIKFECTFDAQTNIVTINAYAESEEGTILSEEFFGIAFINDMGEVDAIIKIDNDESVLLSDLMQNTLVDNIGWLGNLLKGIVTVFAPGVVVVGIAAATIVEVTTAKKNYNENKKLDWQVNGLINNQWAYDGWKFGLSTMDYNGCGVIATYNVMYLLGREEKLSDVAYEIERKLGTLVLGYFGTDPSQIKVYFKDKGIACSGTYLNKSWFENAFKNMRTNQYAIVCFMNNKYNPFKGAHFVAVSRQSNGKYVVYNSGYSVGSITVNDLNGVINDGKGLFLSGFIIN